MHWLTIDSRTYLIVVKSSRLSFSYGELLSITLVMGSGIRPEVNKKYRNGQGAFAVLGLN
jgi:hypothetical protein